MCFHKLFVSAMLPKKTRPYITERLLSKSNKQNKKQVTLSAILKVYLLPNQLITVNDLPDRSSIMNNEIMTLLMVIMSVCRDPPPPHTHTQLHIKRSRHTQFYAHIEALIKELWLYPVNVLRLFVLSKDVGHY